MSATRVSRKEAEEIAELVVKEKTDALNARRTKFGRHVVELYIASLPGGAVAIASWRNSRHTKVAVGDLTYCRIDEILNDKQPETRRPYEKQ